MELQVYSPIAAFTSTGSDSGENWLRPAAFTALTLNTYFSPVMRPWQMNLQISQQCIFINKLASINPGYERKMIEKKHF